MTIDAIKEAVDSLKQLYIDSFRIEVLFLEELTETIEVKFIETGYTSFVTKSSISENITLGKSIVYDELLILKFRGGGCTK